MPQTRTCPAGPATIAMEIFEQESIVTDDVYAPMGDTALGSVALQLLPKQLSPDVCIVGVRGPSARRHGFFLSWREGRAVPTNTCDTIGRWFGDPWTPGRGEM